MQTLTTQSVPATTLKRRDVPSPDPKRGPAFNPRQPGPRWWPRLLAVSAIVLIVVYFGISVFVADQLSRPARRALEGTPADVGLSFEPVEFASLEDGIPLRGWWMPAGTGDQAVIIVHGRNSTRSGHEGRLLPQARGLVKAGYSVLSFDLRAHGESGGVRYSLGPLERRDVKAAIAFVREKGVASGRIGLLGHSMGGAISLLTAADAPEIAAVIADSSYARLTDLLTTELPKASGLPTFFSPGILLLGNALFGVDVTGANPESVIGKIEPRPIFFIHSESDTYIPAEHSRRLWQASGQGPETLWLVPGPRHDQIFDANPEEYLKRIVGFFNRAMN